MRLVFSTKPVWAEILRLHDFLKYTDEENHPYLWIAKNRTMLFELWQILSNSEFIVSTWDTFSSQFQIIKKNRDIINMNLKISSDIKKKAQDPQQTKVPIPDLIQNEILKAFST